MPNPVVSKASTTWISGKMIPGERDRSRRRVLRTADSVMLLGKIENLTKIGIVPVTLNAQAPQGVLTPRRQPVRPRQYFLVNCHVPGSESPGTEHTG